MNSPITDPALMIKHLEQHPAVQAIQADLKAKQEQTIAELRAQVAEFDAQIVGLHTEYAPDIARLEAERENLLRRAAALAGEAHRLQSEHGSRRMALVEARRKAFDEICRRSGVSRGWSGRRFDEWSEAKPELPPMPSRDPFADFKSRPFVSAVAEAASQNYG